MEAVRQANSRTELIRALEELSGRSIRSRADAHNYVRQIRAATLASPSRTGWTFARRTVLATGLLLSFLQYYLIDVYVQIISMPSITFLAAPSNPPLQRSMLELLRSLT